MPQPERIIFSKLPGGRRQVTVSVSSAVYDRINSLREKLEARFRVSLSDEDLVEYLCEKALERMEEWESRVRGTPSTSPAAEETESGRVLRH